MELTQELVRNHFYYCDGKLIRVYDKFGNPINKDTSRSSPDGYRLISFIGRSFLSHRLIFLYHHGYLPEFIDHVNGIRDDNRIENIRACTYAQNAHNRKLESNASSVYKGVGWDKESGKWAVQMKVNGKNKKIGRFKDEIEADKAFDRFAIEYHKEYARLNFPEL